MATTIAQLIATLGLDSTDFDKGLDSAEKKGGGFQKALGGLSDIGGKVLATGFTAAAAGASILGLELSKDVQIAADAQKVQAQLESVIKSTGGVAGITADEASNLATSLSKVTAFDDEAITSGESMLLTFTNIGENVFPRATETILDMSQALGQDLQGSAIQLGKALNDPIQGVTALRRVGVQLTDQQEAQVKAFVEAGDTMSAQTLILDELQREFGGSAKAAGQTFAGQMTIARNQIDNMRESVGGKLLPVLGNLAKMFTDYLMRPEVQKFIDDLSNSIAAFAQKAIDNIPKVVDWFKRVVDFFVNNKPIVVGILAALGVALLAWAATTAIAAATAIAPLLPIIAIMAAVGAAAGLLYAAWTNNWGGIQDKVAAFWAFLQPIIENVRRVLAVVIPVALDIFKMYWNNALAPIRLVIDYFQNVVIPIVRAVANVFSAILGLAIKATAGFIINVLIPPLRSMYEWFNAKILPIIDRVASFLANKLHPAFDGITNVVQRVVSWLDNLASSINGISLPDWLTPGSPTPFELGLRGIADALQLVNRTGFAPDFESNGFALSNNAASVGADAAVEKNVNYQVTINNPTGENSEQSVRRSLKRLSYLGVTS